MTQKLSYTTCGTCGARWAIHATGRYIPAGAGIENIVGCADCHALRDVGRDTLPERADLPRIMDERTNEYASCDSCGQSDNVVTYDNGVSLCAPCRTVPLYDDGFAGDAMTRTAKDELHDRMLDDIFNAQTMQEANVLSDAFAVAFPDDVAFRGETTMTRTNEHATESVADTPSTPKGQAHEIAVAAAEVERLTHEKRRAPIGSQARYDAAIALIRAHRALAQAQAR